MGGREGASKPTNLPPETVSSIIIMAGRGAVVGRSALPPSTSNQIDPLDTEPSASSGKHKLPLSPGTYLVGRGWWTGVGLGLPDSSAPPFQRTDVSAHRRFSPPTFQRKDVSAQGRFSAAVSARPFQRMDVSAQGRFSADLSAQGRFSAWTFQRGSSYLLPILICSLLSTIH